MNELIYDHQAGRIGLAPGMVPVMRDLPVYVGRPDRHHAGAVDPHVLRVGVPLSGDRLTTRIDRSEIHRVVGSHLKFTSILQGSDFYRAWVLLYGPLSAFDAAGIMALDRTNGVPFGRPAVVEGPGHVWVRTRARGESSYSPEIAGALAALGAQLYLCEKLGLGAQSRRYVAIQLDPVADRLTSLLSPLREHLREGPTRTQEDRSAAGNTGNDDYLYRSLLGFGTPLVRELYADRLEKVEIGRRWVRLGAVLHTIDDTVHTRPPMAVEHAESVFKAAVDLACEAFRRDQAARALRSGPDEAEEGEAYAIDISSAQTLFGGGSGEGQQLDIFALTHLAWLWDVNPAEFSGGLYPWRLHFAAARFLGRLKFCHSEEIVLDPEAHWGLRAIRKDLFDAILDPSTAAARAWLRGSMNFDDEFFDVLPQALAPRSGAVPAWRFRPNRAKKKGIL